MPHLVATQPDVEPSEYLLTEDGCTLGRASTCQIVVPRPLVSRQHARIERAGVRFLLRDLDSINGTYVNGLRLHEAHLLTHHDTIGLGEVAAMFSFVDADATQLPASRLRYDEHLMRFYLSQQPVELTPNQFRLLVHLYRQRGRVSSREQCAEAVWGPDFTPGNDATPLDRLVSTIRTTLRKLDFEARVIETRPGLGYQLSDDA